MVVKRTLKRETEIDTLRKEIWDVTMEIYRLVGKRLSLAGKIAEMKNVKGSPVENTEVERKLREAVLEKCSSHGVNLNFGLRLLNLMIEESKRVQKEIVKEKSREKTGFSTPYAIFSKAREMERKGKSVIHLEIGEPDFGPPERVKKAVTEALKSGYSRYTESAGIPQLREKIATKVSERFQVEISPEQVMVTVGGRYAVFLCVASTLLPGDEAIVFEPAWPAYEGCVRSVEGKPVVVHTDLENGWKPDIDLLVESVNKSTRMIILNSPNNPTGKILEKNVFERIVEIAAENDVLILSDEVYSNFAFTSFSSILDFPDCKYVYVSSFSKAFGMTGFRNSFNTLRWRL